METGSTDTSSIETLCGTMFGHRVFRHRLFRSDHDVTISLECNHDGKHLGTRSLMERPGVPDGNMYGAYSWRTTRRGTTQALLSALGFEPGALTYEGVRQALPIGYGRLMSARLVANALHANIGVPLYHRPDTQRDPTLQCALQEWSTHGYSSSGIHFLSSPLLTIDSESQDPAVLQPPTFEDDVTPDDWPGPWKIDLSMQLGDPRARQIIKSPQRLSCQPSRPS